MDDESAGCEEEVSERLRYWDEVDEETLQGFDSRDKMY